MAVEHMRMAADQLVGDGAGNVVEVEAALLLGHARVKHHLQQQVAQLLAQVGAVATRDGVRNLVGLLDRVRSDGGETLLHVPRAAAFGIAQPRHDLEQAL